MKITEVRIELMSSVGGNAWCPEVEHLLIVSLSGEALCVEHAHVFPGGEVDVEESFESNRIEHLPRLSC